MLIGPLFGEESAAKGDAGSFASALAAAFVDPCL